MIGRRIVLSLIVLASLTGLVGWHSLPAAAQTSDPTVLQSASKTGLLINCDQAVQDPATGTIRLERKCTIEDFINQFVVLAQWGQSIVILLGVLFMVWGGVQWITAGGRPSKVEDGKRIIQGTIIGIIISFTAYIIINFSVGAITGTQTSVFNPFSGPISTVFGGKAGLEKPFAGVDDGTNIEKCNAQWDNTCSDQIYCADPGTTAGRVSALQDALNSKGCQCGKVDGCFGNNTATCVRNFQLANDLPPTGMVDVQTETLALGLAGVSCSNPAATARIAIANDALPAFSVERAAGQSKTETGCCVVKKKVDGTPTTMMCADLMSRRTCLSLGADSVFVSGDRCLQNAATKTECGFCYQGGHCFQQTGQYWCANVVDPAVQFSLGACQGHPLCQSSGNNFCRSGLYTEPGTF